eukprot:6406430-Amphidinium_carterae.1
MSDCEKEKRIVGDVNMDEDRRLRSYTLYFLLATLCKGRVQTKVLKCKFDLGDLQSSCITVEELPRNVSGDPRGREEPTPMDLGALGKGSCRYCGRTGHAESDCWWNGKRKRWKRGQG